MAFFIPQLCIIMLHNCVLLFCNIQLLRYIAKNQDNLNLRKLYDEKYYKKYSRFGSFKQQLKRNEGTFVNPLCVIKENFEQQLNRYRKF